MKWNAASFAAMSFVFCGLTQAQTMDPVQLRSMAAACAACHGDQGRAQPGMLPLAGVNKAELLKKMTAYKAGVMPSTIMQQLAKGYSDEQLDALATYFSSQKK